MRSLASIRSLVFGLLILGCAGAHSTPESPGGRALDSLWVSGPAAPGVSTAPDSSSSAPDTASSGRDETPPELIAPGPEPVSPEFEPIVPEPEPIAPGAEPAASRPDSAEASVSEPGIVFGPAAQGALSHRFAPPAFLERPILERDFGGVLRDQWLKAGSGRVFETGDLNLGDFSSIDIPVKFPQTIGRVIGQGANLSVTGSEQITFGGQTRYRVNEPVTEYGRRSKFPQLNMKQHLKIDLKGTVGEKINVLVHHDSDVETPLENRIRLRYDGDDDEIIQSVEMGNTNLAIPGSQFVGYSEQHQGLFGAKVLGKLGALDMTVIASKQEGRTAGASFVGAAARESLWIDDMYFVRNKYFFMIDPLELSGGEVTEIEVYVDDDIGTNNDVQGAVEAYGMLDPVRPPQEASWDDSTYHGFFSLLERNRDYAVDQRTGEVSLLKSLDASHTLAVKYAYGGHAVGGRDGQDRMLLKMIRPAQKYLIEQAQLWGGTIKYERKNVYSLNANYISEQKVKVRIFRKTGGDLETRQRQYEYSKILGIDLEDEKGARAGPAGNWVTDGFADGGTVNGELGLLLFPDLRPFDPDIAFMGERPETLDDRNSKIYDARFIDLKPEVDSKYKILVIFSTPQTIFKLPNVNILEGSESVTLEGRRLTRGVDYDIYYDVGQIKFKTDAAASPDARITVDYQYVPFMALAQQSLVGIQSSYKLSEQSYIGTAWIYQSKKSPEDRPRLGQEPSQIMVGDVSTQLQFTPDWLTAFTNALPLVKAESPSRLSVSAEAAASFPNPNTKGQVYVEDMEGVRDLRSFSLVREAWVPASPPADFRWEDNRKIWWYVKDREVREQDLFPEAESRPGEAFIPVLEINFKNYKYGWVIPDLDPDKQWAGLERIVSKTGSDFADLRFVEIWLRQKEGQGGKMYVDLGAVSENFYHPWADTLNTEDRDNNGKLSEDENTGFDGIMNGQPGDDQGEYEDDWSYKEGDYSRVNGTEGNPSLVPDTEDLDGNGNLDDGETFFRLGFDLADTTYIANRSGDWVHYRIPFADADTVGGTPNWKSIRYIRFFFSGVDSPSVYQLAYLQISGASWLEEGVRNKEDMSHIEPGTREIFEISAKNTRDDPDYIPPYDPGTDPEGYKKREQSLVFSLRNLEPGHSGSIYKGLSGGDYTLYQTLAFYVHGDPANPAEDLYLFTRLGADSINFYEYGVKVKSGWNDVHVKFDEITNLKTQPGDSTTLYDRRVLMRKVLTADGWIAVYGDPSLTRVSRIGAGIVNLGAAATSDQALEVWFDDLRLTDVRREMGLAKRVSIGAAFSDVLTASLDLKQTDTEFRNLGGLRKGSDDTDLSLAASTSLDRFMPPLGVSLPFTIGYHRARSVPTLASRSDVALKGDQRKLQETSSIDDNYSLGFSRKKKSDNPFLKMTLDALSGRASYSRRRSTSPELADSSSGYSGNLAYSFKPWWDHSLKVYRGYALSYFPEGFDVGLTGSTRNSKQTDKRQNLIKQNRYTREIRGDFGVSFKPITGPSLETDYSLKTSRDLDQNKQVPILSSIGVGWELKRNQRAAVTLRPAMGKLLRPTVSYDVNYDENSDPTVRSASDPPGTRRASVSSRSNLDLVLQPSSFLGTAPDAPDSVGAPLYRRLLAVIPDVDVGYFIDRSSKYNKLGKRPSLRFQLGIDPEVDKGIILGTSGGAVQATDEISRSTGFDISTELNPVETVSLTAKYKRNRKDRKYAGASTFEKDTTWPDVAGNFSSLTNLPLLKGAIKTSSLTVGYKASNSVRGEASRETNRAKGSDWAPLFGWDATWKNGLRTTLTLRHTSTSTKDTKGTGSARKAVSNSATFTMRHSFSAPEGMHIPLAGRTLRFKSSLTVSLDMSYESRLETTPSSKNRVERSTRQITVSPKASYSFSKNVTGSADARFDQTTDRQLGQTWRTISLSASVLIRF